MRSHNTGKLRNEASKNTEKRLLIWLPNFRSGFLFVSKEKRLEEKEMKRKKGYKKKRKDREDKNERGWKEEKERKWENFIKLKPNKWRKHVAWRKRDDRKWKQMMAGQVDWLTWQHRMRMNEWTEGRKEREIEEEGMIKCDFGQLCLNIYSDV